MAAKLRTVEQRIEALASRAKGIVTREELIRADITKAQIEQRLAIGLLLPVYRGVYRVGHRAASVEASYMAAVKAGGDGTLLSGLAGGHLLRLVKGKAPPPEVTTPTERRVRSLKTRQSAAICRDYGFRWNGIPVTSVPRTLVDLAARLDLEQLARACHEAGVLHDVTPAMVEPLLAKRPKGAAKLRAVMRGDAKVLLSKLERKFQQRLKEAGLPLPVTNKPAGGRRVDCRWPQHNLTVELQSFTFHNSRYAWENDQRRQREAYA
ncbi:MAG TPA: type IV toxin-antitoxin system AbiEi family antitoxin domain-containing protein, partial [Thermoleophilaceae bacterium]|nr:type IV toxin-antitoxin system AbiEi family antitoxin domain-containing protein [Thermoleophilaceae bacterium]